MALMALVIVSAVVARAQARLAEAYARAIDTFAAVASLRSHIEKGMSGHDQATSEVREKVISNVSVRTSRGGVPVHTALPRFNFAVAHTVDEPIEDALTTLIQQRM